jgi:protein gp37
MKDSKIEWTHHTFNSWIGCTKISPGCQHCYAEAMNKRWKQNNWGPSGVRERTSEAYWRQPVKWNREAEQEGVRKKVFCGSMCDMFEDHPQVETWRVELFQLVKQTPCLDWLLLTKRPENMRKFLPWQISWGDSYPFRNVLLGTSIENQAYLDSRATALLGTPAAVHFFSIEPLLGPIDLKGYRPDWVIVGGESGPNARPMDLEWARDLRDQCKENGIKFFFKQIGGVKDKRGGLDQIPSDLRIREFPVVNTF